MSLPNNSTKYCGRGLRKNQKLRKHANGAGVPAEKPQVVDELHGTGVAQPQVAVPVKQISVESLVSKAKPEWPRWIKLFERIRKIPVSTKRTVKTRGSWKEL